DDRFARRRGRTRAPPRRACTRVCRPGAQRRRTPCCAGACCARSSAMKTTAQTGASALITKRISELGDWRGETLSKIRALIKEAAPDVVEEWKWMGTPVWSHDGIICTGESYKSYVKMTFAKGAFLKSSLWNSSLEGNMRRAIDVREGEKIDEAGLKALIRSA